jgi:hypothetical protein
MVAPIIAAVAASAALGAIGSLAQNKSQVKQLKQQAAIKNLEGDIYEKNAHMQAEADSYNESVARNERNETLARLRVAQAQSGVTGGTLLEIQMRSEQEAELDDMMSRYNNHTKYVATMYEAQKSRSEAQQLLANAKSLKKNRWLNAIFAGANSGLSTATSQYLFSNSGSTNGVEDMSGQSSGWSPSLSAPAAKPAK